LHVHGDSGEMSMMSHNSTIFFCFAWRHFIDGCLHVKNSLMSLKTVACFVARASGVDEGGRCWRWGGGIGFSFQWCLTRQLLFLFFLHSFLLMTVIKSRTYPQTLKINACFPARAQTRERCYVGRCFTLPPCFMRVWS
jgi:hypothetical protein